MNNNPYSAELYQWVRKRSSAKRRMVTGIVFSAIAYFIEMVGVGVYYSTYDEELYIVAAVIILLSIPFWAVGLPLLITGIVGLVKAKRQISRITAEQRRAETAQQQGYQQPMYQQPNYQQPNYQQPNYQQPNYQQPNSQQPIYQPPMYQQQPQQPAEPASESTAKNSAGFVDIDWAKYSPLDAGVSYDPNKNYEFHRAEGFVGSVPQTFVNRTFPKCPLCCTADPHWTISQHNQMSWKGNLYLFKCSCCGGIISMSMPDVTTLGNGGSGVAANPSVGLVNLMAKASSGKQAGAVYAVIESVGESGVTPECNGKEFKLEQLQEMFLRM